MFVWGVVKRAVPKLVWFCIADLPIVHIFHTNPSLVESRHFEMSHNHLVADYYSCLISRKLLSHSKPLGTMRREMLRILDPPPPPMPTDIGLKSHHDTVFL